MREILNAIFYSVRSGCAWRLLPHDFPPWKTIYHYFRPWRIDGISERMHNALRQRVRIGRDPQPSAGIVVESQSVKTTGVGGEQRGYDGGKKVKGRKRHLLVDTQGLVLKAKEHAASVMDFEGIHLRDYEPPDGEAIGLLVRLFRGFLSMDSCEQEQERAAPKSLVAGEEIRRDLDFFGEHPTD